jgi:hypothetical protein
MRGGRKLKTCVKLFLNFIRTVDGSIHTKNYLSKWAAISHLGSNYLTIRTFNLLSPLALWTDHLIIRCHIIKTHNMEISLCIRTLNTSQKSKDRFILSLKLKLMQYYGQHNQLSEKNHKDKNNQVYYGHLNSNPKRMNMKQLKKSLLHQGLPWNRNSKL